MTINQPEFKSANTEFEIGPLARISDPGLLNLSERSDQSVYVEAEKLGG